MANAITLFKKYLPLLDEVYKLSSLTGDLDGDSTLVRQGANTNEIIIPKLTMDGLGDYSRNGGYTSGDVTFTNETVKFNYDRGRKFTVDAMDDEETAGLAFGRLASEFMRTKVVPELDAWRFASYAGAAGISKVAAGATLSTGEDVLKALVAAVNQLDEDEVPQEGRILYITPTLYNAVYAIDSYKSKEVMAGFSKVVKVPQSRFYTAITLKDGKTKTTGENAVDETAGGYEKAASGKDINFMIIHKPAILQYQKHVVSKAFSPSENQDADGWAFVFRAYGLADVYENKVAGIYLHHKA